VVIGIETDRGLFAATLVAAGYQVFAVNPVSTSRYRDRHAVSGAKSDRGDAKVLADMVRTDRHNHRAAVPDSDLAAQAVRVLARAPADDLEPGAARRTSSARRCASSTPPPPADEPGRTRTGT